MISLTDYQLVESIVRKVLAELDGAPSLESAPDPNAIPVGVSARHVHLTAGDFHALFGEESELKPFKALNGGQYASASQVALVSPALKSIENVRVLGPFRKESQVEISRADARFLKVDAPVRPSGKLESTPGITLVGPCGSVTLSRGLIIANRHLHIPPAFANRLSLSEDDIVRCLMKGERETVFCGVQVRVDPSFTPEMHIDTDDANSAGLLGKTKAIILGKGGACHDTGTHCGHCSLHAQSG
jgi:putative phosphotransacetylase